MDDKRRCELLGIKPDYTCGGITPFKGLSAANFKALIDEGFLDPHGAQNYSPEAHEFLSFIEEHPHFTAHGYAVSPERGDCRVSIEGIQGNVARTSRAFFDFIDRFRDADEFEVVPECYAWYD
jgi:hypothetical protein